MALDRTAQIERLFGPLRSDRECGECTVCCTVPAIEPLAKPADTTCTHCTAQGCSIYEQRPEPCRTFFCGWRRLAALPEDMRPDRCGVVVMLEVDPDAANPFDRFYHVARWLSDAPVLEGALSDRLRTLLGQSFVPLYFSPHGSTRKLLVHPTPDVYHAIVDGARPAGRIKDKVRRWQTMLARRFDREK